MRAHLAALGAVVGSLLMWRIPLVVVVVVAVIGLVRRTGPWIVLVVAVACSVLGARAIDGLVPPEGGPVDAWVTLTSDPRPYGTFGVRAGAVWEGRRVTVTAHGPTAGRLDDALAGDQVRVEGRFRPARSGDEFARWRHEVGSISVATVLERQAGAPVARLANTIRRFLADGVAPLDRDDRAVFLGMVIGDDREQSAVVADDFRAAGLGHLLVVSGQNVAFVIAVLAPVARRLRPGPRLVVLASALLFFALLTRFEPSVLRAVGMAGVSVGAATMGTPVDGRRTLSAAVAVLLVIDPFLVHVLAFRLSAAATAGIVWFGRPLADRLFGPEPLRVAMATTIAAQLAVAPLLVATFGPMPLASLPANLLAGPASGPIMVWGCTGGLVAGVLGDPVASVIHWPTGILVGWVRLVARGAALGPPAMLGPGSLTIAAVSVVALARRLPGARAVAPVAGASVVAASVMAAPSLAVGVNPVGAGTVVIAEAHVVVVLDDPHRPLDVVARAREAGLRRIDLVVATDGDAADAYAVLALRERYGPTAVVAPPMHRVPGANSVHPGSLIQLDRVEIVAVGTRGAIRLTACHPAPCHDGPQEEPP